MSMIRAAIIIEDVSQTSTSKVILITAQATGPILLHRNQFPFATIDALRQLICAGEGASSADILVQIRRTLYLVAAVASDLLFEGF